MAVKIGSARSNENGGINGGKAGDQTGGEVSTQNWYLHSKGWIVIRPKRAEAAEKIAKTMENLCANNNFGYCQDHRLSGYNAAKAVNFDVEKVSTPVEIDCSEAVRICVAAAGIYVDDFYTTIEAKKLKATEEFDVTEDPALCKSSTLLLRGDILVTKTKGHTVVVLSNGSKAKPRPKYSIGWNRDSKGWWYSDTETTYRKSTWSIINHHKYYFKDDGYAATGWQLIDGKWYYFEPTVNDPLECAMYVSDADGAQAPGVF